MQMKTAISLPDPIFHSAERLAARLGISRSELYRRAIETLLERHDQSTITSQLDAVYGTGETNPGLDPDLAVLQSQAIRGGAGR
jgi:predicted transcriptional regulator